MKIHSELTKKNYEVELFSKGNDFIIRHNSLKEIYNELKAEGTIRRKFEQEQVGRLDQSTFYAYNCFLELEIEGKRYESDGFGSISYAEIMYSARRGEDITIKDSFRMEMARNRAFDDAFISLMRFSFEDGGHTVRSFYSSEAVSVTGAKKIAGRNITRDAVQAPEREEVSLSPAVTAPASIQPQAPAPVPAAAVQTPPQAVSVPDTGSAPVNKQAQPVQEQKIDLPPFPQAAPETGKNAVVTPPTPDPNTVEPAPVQEASPIAMMGNSDSPDQDWLNMFPGQDDPGTGSLYPEDPFQDPFQGVPDVPNVPMPEPEVPMPSAPAAPVYVAGIRDAEKGSAKVTLSNGQMLEYDPHLNEWFGDPGEGISLDQVEAECERMTGMPLSEYIRQASIYR